MNPKRDLQCLATVSVCHLLLSNCHHPMEASFGRSDPIWLNIANESTYVTSICILSFTTLICPLINHINESLVDFVLGLYFMNENFDSYNYLQFQEILLIFMQTKIWKMLSSLFLESTNSQILQMSPFFIKHFFGKRVIFHNDVFCWNKQSDRGTRFWRKKILKLLLFFFIRCEFWKFNCWIICSYYIFYDCKFSRRSKINSYIINQIFKFQVF